MRQVTICNLALNIIVKLIEQGYKVMLINREMSNTEMLRKLIVLESENLLYSKIRRGEIEGSEDEIANEVYDKKLFAYLEKQDPKIEISKDELLTKASSKILLTRKDLEKAGIQNIGRYLHLVDDEPKKKKRKKTIKKKGGKNEK